MAVGMDSGQCTAEALKDTHQVPGIDLQQDVVVEPAMLLGVPPSVSWCTVLPCGGFEGIYCGHFYHVPCANVGSRVMISQVLVEWETSPTVLSNHAALFMRLRVVAGSVGLLLIAKPLLLTIWRSASWSGPWAALE